MKMPEITDFDVDLSRELFCTVDINPVHYAPDFTDAHWPHYPVRGRGEL